MKLILNYTKVHGYVNTNAFSASYFGRIHKKYLKFLEKILPF